MKTKKNEKRSIATKHAPQIRSFNFDLRAVESQDKKEIIIEGYAAIFDSPSDSGGLSSFTEVIRPGAFKSAIGRDDVRALFNHDANFVLGRTLSGTLSLQEDEKGLRIIIKAPNTQWARDLAESMNRGDINQMSFSFIPDGEDGERWNWDTKPVLREILKVRLYDVSVVTYPWYDDTNAEVTQRKQQEQEKEKNERLIAEALKEKRARELYIKTQEALS